jgi:phospholipid transport system substrate-binding protein
VVRRAFNYEEMAERALGESSEKTSVSDRRQFTRLFVKVLRDDLADKLRDYALPQVAYLSEQRGGTDTQVLVAPAGREVDTRIEFDVVQRSGRWLINDVSIDGASIVATYHAQFSRILREGSFSDLMEFLKQKALVA